MWAFGRLSTSIWQKPSGAPAPRICFPKILYYLARPHFARRILVSSSMLNVVGWDIGGVNIKAARLLWQAGEIVDSRVVVHPFEIWRKRENLPGMLEQIGDELGIALTKAMAVTMTAEPSDTFRSKREGVLSILDTIDQVFPNIPIYPLSLEGDFVPLSEARQHPLDFAASNWLASGLYVAHRHCDCIL